MDYFVKFIDQDILRLICTESNRYALQKDVSKPLNLSIQELEIFLGICIYMSLVKLNTFRKYWSTDANVPAVRDFMSLKRFELIKSCLHFANAEAMPGKDSPNYDRIFKIRPFLDKLNARFNMNPMTELYVLMNK